MLYNQQELKLHLLILRMRWMCWGVIGGMLLAFYLSWDIHNNKLDRLFNKTLSAHNQMITAHASEKKAIKLLVDCFNGAIIKTEFDSILCDRMSLKQFSGK
jgi:hypothetical protein